MSKTDDARQALTGALAAIVESSQDAIFRKTLDGVIESWNAGAQSIYGYRPEEIIGHPVSTLAPPDRKDEISLHPGTDRPRGARRALLHEPRDQGRKDDRRLVVDLPRLRR